MGIMDWDQAAADLALVRQDNEVDITIRRGDTTLNPQPVRIARAGGAQGRERDSEGAQQVVGRVVVLGPKTLDVQPGDRFTLPPIGGPAGDRTLYQVAFIRPNRRAAVVAEAEIIE
jgi:hypothetical protein